MHIPRIYQKIDIKENDTILLDKKAANHLVNVLRLSVENDLIIFNGQGGEFSAKISQISKQQVFIQALSFHPVDRESKLNIHLGQGISRGDHMDFSLQKSVELGVSSITPLLTKRCNIKLTKERWQKRMTHWENIIISACEQCGRNILPKLNPVVSVSDWLDDINAKTHIPHDKSQETNTLKLLFNPLGKQSLSQLNFNSNSIVLLIGPEGGLTETEIDLAKRKNFIDSQLGPRILRTETAAITAISILQYIHGEM